ncbi:MAG: hypothetical protein EOO09_19255 [Chitinophagaceae bacterium]|nr:MAG: hypothetical protein EOO09_19255 [Chitinophagaceae bacterium]
MSFRTAINKQIAAWIYAFICDPESQLGSYHGFAELRNIKSNEDANNYVNVIHLDAQGGKRWAESPGDDRE